MAVNGGIQSAAAEFGERESQQALGVVDSRTIMLVVLFVLAILVLPLLGVWLQQRDIQRYLEFPPQSLYVEHAPFSWGIFLLYAGFIAVSVGPFMVRALRSSRTHSQRARKGTFPWWGFAGLLCIIAGWSVAWTQLPVFDALQIYIFFLLWFGYVLVANAIVLRRDGSAPLTRNPFRFGVLFAASACFWWLFEYLNRFTQNWIYLNADQVGRLEYALAASLCFSTVLPAVAVTKELVAGWACLGETFRECWAISWLERRAVAWRALFLGCISLVLLGVLPQQFFAFIWMAPLAVWFGLGVLLGAHGTLLRGPVCGDWREVVQWACAALICGFFWEFWNVYSFAKWEYLIPHVQAFHVFKMPLLGFAGYLPFGVMCGAASKLFLGDKHEACAVVRRGK